jgi:hypothetical protein
MPAHPGSSPDKMRRFVEDEITGQTPGIQSIGLKLD